MNECPNSLSQIRVLLQVGRFREAEMLCRASLERQPGCGQAHLLLGIALGRQNLLTEAVAATQQAISYAPDSADAHLTHAQALSRLGILGGARTSCDRAITLSPESGKAHLLLSIILAKSGKLVDAVTSCTKAVGLMPHSESARFQLAIALFKLGRYEESVSHWVRLTDLRPDRAENRIALSEALWGADRVEEAIETLRRGIKLQPNEPEYHMLLARGLLAVGQYPEGFREFEHRWERRDNRPKRPGVGAPMWSGEPLHEKTILVHSERGFGDTIQFCRFLPALSRRASRIVFLVQPGLSRLLRSLGGFAEIVETIDPGRRFDFQVGLMSLPHRLGTTLGSIPRETPYLFADPKLIAQWKSQIGTSGFRIGISWQGNPQSSGDSSSRAVPLAKFDAITRIPGVRLISIQAVHGLDQLNSLPAGMVVENLGTNFNAGSDAFVDTAAVMECLDLVITSDSANAHLAGALGRRAWIALRRNADWRWLRRRNDSPWYPTLRLFRQAENDNWMGPINSIVTAVGVLVNQHTRFTAGHCST